MSKFYLMYETRNPPIKIGEKLILPNSSYYKAFTYSNFLDAVKAYVVGRFESKNLMILEINNNIVINIDMIDTSEKVKKVILLL